MKSINETVDKMLFPFATSLISIKGLHREKIFQSELSFIENKIKNSMLYHINMKYNEKYQ